MRVAALTKLIRLRLACADYTRDLAQAARIRSHLPYSSYKIPFISIPLCFWLLRVRLLRRPLWRSKTLDITHLGWIAIITLFRP